jgi:hypothetical protein
LHRFDKWGNVDDLSLLAAIGKLAIAGEQAGFSVEQMIQILNGGFSVEDLSQLIARRLEPIPESVNLSATSRWVM